MSTTIPSVAGTDRELVINPWAGDAVMFRVDTGGARGRPVAVDRTRLAAALVKEADLVVVNGRDLPEVDGQGVAKVKVGSLPNTLDIGWGAWPTSPGIAHAEAAARCRDLIRGYAAVLAWHERQLEVEQAKKAELDTIERFLAENGARPTDALVHALHEKGFRP